MTFKIITTCVKSLLLVSLPKYRSQFIHRSSILYVNLKVKYKMKTAYFLNKDDKVLIRFIFENNTFNVNKPVLLNRNLNDTLEILLNRVELKLSGLLAVKQKKYVDAIIPEIKPVLLSNNYPLPSDVTLQDIFSEKVTGDLKLRILENDYDIVLNIPIIDSIVLPPDIKVGCPVYPVKVEGHCVNINDTIYTWHKSKSKKFNWTECGQGFCYVPTEEDKKYFLKLSCIPRNELKSGPEYEVVKESEVVEFNGGEEIKKRHEFTKEKTNDHEVRIVCYNILADTYTMTKEAKTILFTYCDPQFINKNYRKDLLLLELTGYNADIICMQEVETKLFINHLCPVLKMQQLTGVLNEKDSNKEGCAIFYNSEKFQVSYSNHYNYSSEINNNPLFKDFKDKIIHNKKLYKRVITLPTVFQVVVLECLKNPGNLLVVGNTHLYFHPDADHIRLLQSLIAFKILLNITGELKKNLDKNISILLCGDLNSSPDCRFHQFLNEGSISENHIGWKQKEDEVIENISCSHSLNMKSACGTPKYTNYTSLFKDCLDYIYFQTDHLEVKQVVPLPTEEALSRQTAIPSEFFPSDHIALVADLKFKSV